MDVKANVKIRGSRSRSPRDRSATKQSSTKSHHSRQRSSSPEHKTHKHRSRSKERRQSPNKNKSHKKRSHSRDGRHGHSQDKNHKRSSPSQSRDKKASPSHVRRRSPSRERKSSPKRKSRSRSREKLRSSSPVRVKRRSLSSSREKGRKRASRSRSKDKKGSPPRGHSSHGRNSKERKHKGRDSLERRHRRSRSRSLSPKRRGNESKSSSKHSLDGTASKLSVKSPEKTKPGALPLSVTLGAMPTGQAMTPQLLLQQTMAVVNAQAAGLTNVALPKYYNPAAVNPLKYAEQMQKRKLLWQGTKEKEEVGLKQQPSSSNCWEKTHFMEDQDGKLTAKFRKLMGIKKESEEAAIEPASDGTEPDPNILKQEALFRDLDQQYEMARISTHTQRGVGLGYSAYPALIFPK